MIITQIKKACDNLGVKYQKVDEAGLFIKIRRSNGKSHFFIANNLGLNDEVIEKICLDKAYTHDLLNQCIRMPKSNSYLDSQPPEVYQNFTNFKSHQEIVDSILTKHDLPVVLKPNSKSMGINVYACNTKDEVAQAVDKILNKNSYQYDYVLLAQENINIKKEFRVLVYKSEMQFVYEKDNRGERAQFVGNLSPLHFSNAQAVLLTPQNDSMVLSNIADFIKPIFVQMNLVYAGLDLAQDELGQLYLLEINSKPGFDYFIKDNGDEKVVKMLEKIIRDLR